VVDADLRERLGAMAVKAAAAVNYYSAGTIECLMGPDKQFYFLEMNTRLQVEHPVTEMVWGIDLVKAQLRIARGETLGFAQKDLAPSGHAVECRIYAEDPAHNFAPSPGLIRGLTLPQGPGVRNDNGVYGGYTVPVYYDPMLSKLICHAGTRIEAIDRMLRALQEYRVDGIRTSIPFFTFLMQHPDFRAANFDTGFIDRILPELDLQHRQPGDATRDAALIAAAIMAFEDAQKVRLPEETKSRWRQSGRLEALRGRD
jgi:acetyl-CoA carboxylase biotin carboxylase subunit